MKDSSLLDSDIFWLLSDSTCPWRLKTLALRLLLSDRRDCWELRQQVLHVLDPLLALPVLAIKISFSLLALFVLTWEVKTKPKNCNTKRYLKAALNIGKVTLSKA